MEYTFFYSSLLIIWVLAILLKVLRKPALPKIIIGITTVGFSLIHDIVFGELLKLFNYINPQESLLYTLLSAVFIYPLLNIIYVTFLPENNKGVILYTSLWTAAMLVFEYFSLLTKTIVFTGWKPIPWSIVVYIATYLWIYFFYKYLLKKLK